VWISEQTAIISLYNINWLVFITQTESVYCAVRFGCYINQIVSPWKGQSALLTVCERKDTKLLPHRKYEIMYFLYSTITSDNIWTHYHNPELRSRSLGYRLSLPDRKKDQDSGFCYKMHACIFLGRQQQHVVKSATVGCRLTCRLHRGCNKE